MTATPSSGTLEVMPSLSARAALDSALEPRLTVEPGPHARVSDEAPPSFEQIYQGHVDYLWRSARRMGVRPASVDDVVQEVFLVVHRRLHEFERRASFKTWLSRILVNVVQTHFRTRKRKAKYFEGGDIDPDDLHGTIERTPGLGPELLTQQKQANRVLHEILGQLDEEKRMAFVLVELEELSVVEAAETLEVNVNTLHSRLRAARKAFSEAAARFRASEGWTKP
ncbi:MAG: RNA polymerase sigma factor [Polyangiaceae bacterium]